MANGKVFEDIQQLRVNDAVSDGIDATVSNQKLLLYNAPIKQIDVINIISRFSTFDELQVSAVINFSHTKCMSMPNYLYLDAVCCFL